MATNKCADCVFWDSESEENLCMHNFIDMAIGKCTHEMDVGGFHPKETRHDCHCFKPKVKEKQYCEYCGKKLD